MHNSDFCSGPKSGLNMQIYFPMLFPNTPERNNKKKDEDIEEKKKQDGRDPFYILSKRIIAELPSADINSVRFELNKSG